MAWDLRVPSACAHRMAAPSARAGVAVLPLGSELGVAQSCRRRDKRQSGVEKYWAVPAVCWVLSGCSHGGAGGFLLPRVTVTDPVPWSESLQIHVLEAVTCSKEEKRGTEALVPLLRVGTKPKPVPGAWSSGPSLSSPIFPERPVSIPASYAKAATNVNAAESPGSAPACPGTRGCFSGRERC